jgi:Fanconi anemia group M protein
MKKVEQQSRIAEFSEGEGGERVGSKEGAVEVFCDMREKEVTELLIGEGAQVTVRPLDVGDFLISDRMIVERKTTNDFESSIVDGRLFEQASRLEGYDFPILIIEGEMKVERVAQNAFMGALMALIVDFGIHVINTKNGKETAHIVFLLAKREQQKDKRPIRLLEKRKALTFEHQQLRVLQAFSNIGPIMAKKLLEEFGSLEKVFVADLKELERVLGKKKAGDFKQLLVGKGAIE